MTRFWQESQGHDKDLPAPQRWSSRSFWRDLGMLHLGMGNLPPIWLDWTRILYLGLSVKKADDDIGILSWWGWTSIWHVYNSVCGGLNRPLSSISSHAKCDSTIKPIFISLLSMPCIQKSYCSPAKLTCPVEGCRKECQTYSGLMQHLYAKHKEHQPGTPLSPSAAAVNDCIILDSDLSSDSDPVGA